MTRLASLVVWLASLTTVSLGVAAPNRWTPISPPGGFARSIVVDETTPGTIYTVLDGLPSRSTDGGATWSRRATGLPNVVRDTDTQLLVDRVQPGVLNAIIFNRLFRSVDGGASWVEHERPSDFLIPTTSFFVNDPVTPGRSYLVFAEGSAQIYVSTDAGDHWTPLGVPPGPVQFPAVEAFAVDPSSPDTFYADVSGSFFVSTNQGSSWTKRGTGLPVSGAMGRLLVAPTVPTTLYLYQAGLFRSTDGGANWTQTGLGRTDLIPRALDPADPLTLYATRDSNGSLWGELFKTTDGGASWTPLDRHAPGMSDWGGILDLAIDPADPSRLWAATSNGVLTSANGGTAWTITTAGQATVAGALSLGVVLVPSPSPAVYVLGSTLWRSADGGTSWSPHTPQPPLPPSTFEVLSLAIDPSAPATQYLGSSVRGVFKSTDGGDVWVPANSGLTDLHVHALVIDPATPAVLYAATDGGLMRSGDGAGSWSPRNVLVTSSLVLDPLSPATLYAGFGAFKSVDAGLSFSTPPLVASLAGPAPGYFPSLTALALTPSPPATAYLGFSALVITYPRVPSQIHTLFESLDGLGTGVAVQAFSPGTITIDPTDNSTIYAERSGRVARSTDAAATFTSFSAGIPLFVGNPNIAFVQGLTVAPGGDAVYAAAAQGTYRIDLPVCTIDADCDDGEPCTTDTCVAGRCEHAALPLLSPCTGVDECAFNGACFDGQCAPSFPTPLCDDGDPCTTDTCAVGGTCLHFTVCVTTTTTVPGSTTTTSTTLPALLSGRLLTLRSKPTDATRKQVRVVSTDPAVDLGAGNGSVDDPVLHGATLRIASDSAAGAFDTTYPLAGSWSYLGKAGQNKGYRWKSKTAPITSVAVRPGKSLRVTGRGAALGHDLDDDPNPVAVVLSLGGRRTSCLRFGGSTKFVATRSYTAKLAPAPPACP